MTAMVLVGTRKQLFRIRTTDKPGWTTNNRFCMVDDRNCLRKHVRVFINDDMITNLSDPAGESDEITILQALSGG